VPGAPGHRPGADGHRHAPVNGIELTAEVLARWPRLKVLMFSMYDNPEFVQRALQAGASGYLLKDAPASEIVAAIGVVMSGATFLSPGVSAGCSATTPRPCCRRASQVLAARWAAACRASRWRPAWT
jgi:DNA-binding NarL/FixJ family response regulator